jgi:RNA polymerase sigma factor (sigma-70 family)
MGAPASQPELEPDRAVPPSAAEIFRSARGELVRLLARHRIPRPDGEDLLQEAFLALLTKGAGARDPRLWLVGALRVLCLRYRRSLAYRVYQAIDADRLEAFADPRETGFERRVLAGEIRAAMARLCGRCREILRLRYALGCDRFETGAAVGCRPSSVGTLEKRCLAALGSALGACRRCPALRARTTARRSEDRDRVPDAFGGAAGAVVGGQPGVAVAGAAAVRAEGERQARLEAAAGVQVEQHQRAPQAGAAVDRQQALESRHVAAPARRVAQPSDPERRRRAQARDPLVDRLPRGRARADDRAQQRRQADDREQRPVHAPRSAPASRSASSARSRAWRDGPVNRPSSTSACAVQRPQ